MSNLHKGLFLKLTNRRRLAITYRPLPHIWRRNGTVDAI